MLNVFTEKKLVNRGVGFGTGAIALAVASALFVPGYGKTNVAQANPMLKQNAEIEEVSDSPTQYVGESVTLRGNVEDIIDRNSFVIQETDELIGGDKVLVLNAAGEPMNFADDEEIPIQVTGQVRLFRAAELEREFGWDFWDPDLYVEFENKPVVIAQSVALAPEPDDIRENPQLFYGKTIAVRGEIDEYFSINAFRLEDEEFFQGDELLVLNSDTGKMINAGDDVVVTGVLRPFVMADIEREFDVDLWDFELRRELEAEFDRRPMMYAREVYSVTD
ncbi:hypothetical protein [Phormidium sp. CCY1219]|uniref:hypothetical protein n=1 Tax=Phormidium sp. CCY1219 TaxID=2886104 RepID=UPI002D1EE7B1|nr:hypothetical protein [Phormidium sp. CCY1219]MEB3827714.1 hypothetical protein [Phormidium sp. CCY1219]